MNKRAYSSIKLERIEIYILNRLLRRENYASRTMNRDLVKRIIDLYEIAFAQEFYELPDFLSIDSAGRIMDRLPEEVINNPPSLEAIIKVISVYDQMLAEEFLADTANSRAFTAADYNNRANARWELGRVDEALSDYDMAYQLEPNKISFRMNRLQLLLELNRKEEVIQELAGINEAFKGDFHNLSNIINCNWRCNRMGYALKWISEFLRQLIPCSRLLHGLEMDPSLLKRNGSIIVCSQRK